jgi:hypothetical protein
MSEEDGRAKRGVGEMSRVRRVRESIVACLSFAADISLLSRHLTADSFYTKVPE